MRQRRQQQGDIAFLPNEATNSFVVNQEQQTLQKAHTVALSASSKKPPQSDRSLIAGPADGAVACQGIGAPKEIELSPVASADRVEQDAEDQEKEVEVEDDPRYAGLIDLD